MVLNQRLFTVMTLCIASALAVTTQQDQKLGAACEALLNPENPGAVASLVRVIFHDCIGGCDGCIDTNITEPVHGDVVNVGLDNGVSSLNEAYKPFANSGISRADFYAKCGQMAAEQARKNAGNSKPSDLPLVMRYGRVDCDGSPRERAEDFPSARMGLDGVLSWCSRVFKFSQRECVAIMGAHTLGKTRPQTSGFNFSWVPDGQFDLDNRYYIDLSSREYFQENISPDETGSLARWQYSTSDERLMLNTDMSLLRKITPDQFGKAETVASSVGFSPVVGLVMKYARSNKLWLRDFGRAFTKLMETGNKLTDISDSVPGGAGSTPRFTAGYYVPNYAGYYSANYAHQPVY